MDRNGNVYWINKSVCIMGIAAVFLILFQLLRNRKETAKVLRISINDLLLTKKSIILSKILTHFLRIYLPVMFWNDYRNNIGFILQSFLKGN